MKTPALRSQGRRSRDITDDELIVIVNNALGDVPWSMCALSLPGEDPTHIAGIIQAVVLTAGCRTADIPN